ncbi:uncharacterized protein LOC126822585 [Patella vulgata]|uniref:uncharacterized protein LOC126822585 n=1 Tax=Patella vulgata TaxID=6465 RepID=UPI0024A945D0|nr:uncharacterized protein LOC126822585 [Patella vulgata]
MDILEKTMISVLIGFCFITMPMVNCGGKNVEFILETEAFVDVSWTVDRPLASGNKTTLLMTGKRINFPFCLRKESAVLVKQVLYSKDDPGNSLTVQFDAETVAKGETYGKTNGGNQWSVINSMSLAGNEVVLQRGRHIMSVFPESTDQNGVELDKVVLVVDDDLLNEDMFTCKTYCLPEIPQHRYTPVERLPVGRLVQRSTTTNCTEKKNVVMDLYHSSIKKFRITAQHPSYRSLLNVRKANYTNCDVPKPTIWEFGNFSLTDGLANKALVDAEGVLLQLEKTPDAVGCFDLGTNFNITVQRRDIDIPQLGGKLSLTINGHTSDVTVDSQIKDRVSEWIHFARRTIPKSQSSLEIPIDDGTWSRVNNQVQMRVCGGGKNFEIESWKLTRRELKSDKAEIFADTGDFAAEAVFRDIWWMGDEGMKLSVKGSTIVSYGHYIRIYTRVPWGGYSQTLVIYQDGVIRLLPPTMHGTDWIPFGSFVLTGRFDPKKRLSSHAAIQNIEIIPQEFRLIVHYADGNVWEYKLSNGLERTWVDVDVKSEGAVEELSTLPFIQFRSMFVKDGRSNVDRLSVNGLKEHRILDNWSSLFGSSFFFFRGCASDYHTQAPDIHVELLG